MSEEPLARMLKGDVEVDETYAGGESREGRLGCESERKTPVVALIERDGNMHARPIQRVTAAQLQGATRDVLHRESRIITDERAASRGVGQHYDGGHAVLRHSLREYLNRDVHTNSAECHFALLKRTLHGAFHQASKRHLARYCDEYSFRGNWRKVEDGDRVAAAVRDAFGKRRLLYAHA